MDSFQLYFLDLEVHIWGSVSVKNMVPIFLEINSLSVRNRIPKHF